MDCPNCITPWKCNGPHLLKGSDYHYESDSGYYMKQGDIWLFFPFEKGFSSEQLLEISDILKSLNKT